MTDIQRFEAHEQLQTLLDQHGVVTPEGSLVKSAEMGARLGVTRQFGLEGMTPSGGIGRLLVSQVEQLPDPYTASLPEGHADLIAFQGSKLSGILAESRFSMVAYRGLYVARKSVLSMENQNTQSHLHLQRFHHFGLGVFTADEDMLLQGNVSNLNVIRTLKPAEMEHSEPSTRRMVVSALRRWVSGTGYPARHELTS